MEKELEKKEQNHEVSIALIQRDIQYINQNLTNIGVQIAAMDKNYARKDELKDIEKSIDGIHKEIKDALEKKVDKSEFEPIRKILTRINWLLISTFIIALLALIVKAGAK